MKHSKHCQVQPASKKTRCWTVRTHLTSHANANRGPTLHCHACQRTSQLSLNKFIEFVMPNVFIDGAQDHLPIVVNCGPGVPNVNPRKELFKYISVGFQIREELLLR